MVSISVSNVGPPRVHTWEGFTQRALHDGRADDGQGHVTALRRKHLLAYQS